jgi:rhamnose transport system permease protein
VLAVVFAVVLHATPLGRAIFAIGAGQEAGCSRVRVKRIKFWLYVLRDAVRVRRCALTLRFVGPP